MKYTCINQQLAYHQQQLQVDDNAQKARHRSLLEHYTLLLARWET